MRRGLLLGLLLSAALAVALAAQPRHRPLVPDPARNAVRVELRLTTDARFASVRVLGENFVVARGRRITGPPDLRTAVLENLLALSGNVEGEPATGAWRLVLTQVDPCTSVTWLLNVQPGHRATVEIVDYNQESRPHAVDRFDGAAGATFSTNAAALLAGGPLRPTNRPRLVLAQYYPWYDRAAWADPALIDQPLRLYSNDDPADVRRNLDDVRRAGIDGIIVSWDNAEGREGWNFRRLQLLLQVAQQVGLRVSVQSRPPTTDAAGRYVPASTDTIARWLEEIVTWFGTQPAFLQLDGRPVLFAYAWPYADEETWRAAMARLAAAGQHPFVIADTTGPEAAYALVDATYTYADNLFVSDLDTFTRRMTLLGRTYHLLGAAYGPPRLCTVTVSPGYDERHLGRPNPRSVDREEGAFYARQWGAAIDHRADWVLITTWNEWAENTQIEASQRYGELYPSETRYWATRFKASP